MGGTVILKHNNAAGTGVIVIHSIADQGKVLLADGLTIGNALYMQGNNKKITGLESRATSATLTGALTGDLNNYGATLQALSGQTMYYTGNIAAGRFITGGAGTVVLSGQTNTGLAAAVETGTLRLDYTTHNTTKLSGMSTLAMAGGRLELKGGNQTESITGQLELGNGASHIIRTSGSSTLAFGSTVVNYSGAPGEGATLDFGEASLATVTAGGLLASDLKPTGRVTLNGTDWAVAAASGANQAVVAYTGYTSLADGGTIANNSSIHYLLQGNVTGLGAVTTSTGSLIKKDATAATISMGGRTLYARGIMINQAGGDLTVGSSVGDGIFGATGGLFNYSGSAKLLINANMSDTHLTKSGEGLVEVASSNNRTATTYANEGTLLLSGSNTGTGKYEVRGELAVNGAIGTGAVTVFDGGLLSGEGTINGATTLQKGGKLSAGYASTDTLTFAGGLDISASADMKQRFVFTLGTSSDKIDITSGTFAIGSGLLDFDSFAFTAGSGFGEGVYTLFDSTSLSGSLAASNLTGTVGGLSSTLSLSGNDVLLTVVPEPGVSLLLLTAGGFALLFRRRRAE